MKHLTSVSLTNCTKQHEKNARLEIFTPIDRVSETADRVASLSSVSYGWVVTHVKGIQVLRDPRLVT